ncbi:hypothetical protein RY72_00495 [Akkermansia muciniphila]|nr:hypothetical protein [Akkermansia muciniphila]
MTILSSCFYQTMAQQRKYPRTIKTRRLPSPQAHWEKSDAGTDTAPCGRLCPIPLTASIK